MAKNSVLEKFKKLSGNEYSFVMNEEDNPYIIKGMVDTGCYLLNAALCNGNIYGGLPLGRRVIFGGESGVAKSLLIMYIIKSFLKENEGGNVIFFETEGSSVIEQADSMKVPKDRILVLPVNTVQDFKIQSTKILGQIKEEQKKGNKEQYLFVLDSLGMMTTNNEYSQAVDGSEKKDMSKAGEIKSAFRTITLDLALTNIPLLIANHTYANVGGYGNQRVQSGGSGPVYAGDVLFQITKAKEKEGDSRVGSLLSLKIQKSRYQIEENVYKLLLLYSKGLWKYSGMLEMALKYDVFKKEGNSYVVSNDGTKVSKKELYKNAEVYYTKEILDKINEKLMADVGFGQNSNDGVEGFSGSDDEEGDEC